MEIDVTKDYKDVTKLIFRNDGEDDFKVFLEQAGSNYFRIKTTECEEFHIQYEDIDNLIKALEKAKELWG